MQKGRFIRRRTISLKKYSRGDSGGPLTLVETMHRHSTWFNFVGKTGGRGIQNKVNMNNFEVLYYYYTTEKIMKLEK